VGNLVIVIVVYGLLAVSGLLLLYCALTGLGLRELLQDGVQRWKTRSFYEGIDLRTEVRESRGRKHAAEVREATATDEETRHGFARGAS
jgi:hypothetical protein